MGVSLRSRSEGRTATSVRLKRGGLGVAAAFALLFVFYAWTATTPGNRLFNKLPPQNLSSGGVDYYNLQADAFLHGRLWVDVPFDPQLLTAGNPYALPNGSGLADGSFYKGKYYLTWGPAPAVTTFLPPRLVGLRIQENLAVVLYCFFGVVFAAMTLTRLVREFVPGTSRVVLWTANVTMALATSIPWQLRTPTIYETAIGAAFFFMMAGVLVLVRELLREEMPRRGRLAAVGTLFGLGVLSRPTMVFVVIGLVGFALVLRPEARKVTVPLIAVIPAVAGVIFLIYNMARFSGPLDFGNKWQTSGIDVRNFPYNQVSNLPPALFAYLVAPLHMTVGFPYFHLPPPPDAPLAKTAGFRGEPTGSLLWAVPFALLVFAAVTRRRPTAPDEDTAKVRAIVLTLLGIGALVLLSGAYGLPGYTERYKLDFLPWIVMAATLAWAARIQNSATPRRAAWWRRGGVALGAWGALVGVAVSFTGYYESFLLFDYGRYQSLERATSVLPTLVTKIAGRPMVSTILSSTGAVGTIKGGYTTLDIDGATFLLTPQGAAQVTIVSPNARDARLTFNTATQTTGTYTVYQSAHNETTSAPVHNGSAGTLPLHLRRGVNYIALGVTAGADVPRNAQPLAQLSDFRVR